MGVLCFCLDGRDCLAQTRCLMLLRIVPEHGLILIADSLETAMIMNFQLSDLYIGSISMRENNCNVVC